MADPYYKERREQQQLASQQKKARMLSDEYTDWECYSCEKCSVKESCPFFADTGGQLQGCEFRKVKFVEKFAEMIVTGDENVDRAVRILAKMEVELDLALVKNAGSVSKTSVALSRTLIHGYLKVHESLKGRTINLNKTDLLGMRTPELEALEKKLMELEAWRASQFPSEPTSPNSP